MLLSPNQLRVKLARVLLAVSLLTIVTSASAKRWRGIIPLRSNRADVLRTLGKPTRSDYIYDFDEGTVRIMYTTQRCEQGIPSGWGNWNVPPDTVVNISVEADIPLSKQRLRNLKKYKWYTDDAGATYYRLRTLGLEYTVQEGRITEITYGPSTKDNRLLCNKHVPEIRY